MKKDQQIRNHLALHREIMVQLEQLGMSERNASRESLRRMEEQNFKYNHWRDYFTAVELEGLSLPH